MLSQHQMLARNFGLFTPPLTRQKPKRGAGIIRGLKAFQFVKSTLTVTKHQLNIGKTNDAIIHNLTSTRLNPYSNRHLVFACVCRVSGAAMTPSDAKYLKRFDYPQPVDTRIIPRKTLKRFVDDGLLGVGNFYWHGHMRSCYLLTEKASKALAEFDGIPF